MDDMKLEAGLHGATDLERRYLGALAKLAEVREKVRTDPLDTAGIGELVADPGTAALERRDKAVAERVLRATAEAIREAAPPLNAELSMHGGAGPFVDKGMEGYIEGVHDAFDLVNDRADTYRTPSAASTATSETSTRASAREEGDHA